MIVFFINGANQAGLEFARAAGADFAGLSNLSAFPVRGTLLPLTGEYRHLPLAAANAVALGKPADDAVGTLSSGEELDSLATLAKQSGRRVGIISDSLLTGWLRGRFMRMSPVRTGRKWWRTGCRSVTSMYWPERVPSPDGRSAGDRLGDTMARIGYRNVLEVES